MCVNLRTFPLKHRLFHGNAPQNESVSILQQPLQLLPFFDLRCLGQGCREIDVIGFRCSTLHSLNFDFMSHRFICHYNSIYTIIKGNVKKTPEPSAPPTPAQPLSIGTVLFAEADLRQLAKDLKFTKRTPRKIDLLSLLASLCTECLQGSPSCNDLAAQIQTHSGNAPSRQAVSLRLNQAFENILQRLLEMVIREKTAGDGAPAAQTMPAFRNYRRVLVQDSTIIKLPSHLFEDFSGVANAHGSVCNARIQATYNLLDHCLLAVAIDPYSKNDQAAAPELSLQKDDLVLRDRGYLVVNEIQRHREAGADCIYRHRTGTAYLDPQTGHPIDLPALLKDQGRLDLEVLLNNEARTRVHLVTAPVDVETANRRRRKAKTETHGHQPSKAVLELMDWTIFITTIPAALASFKEILAIYGLRWRIEIIFKAWKSHLKFPLLHRVSKLQMAILLKARLLIITACTNRVYGSLERTLQQNYDRRLSLLKFMRFLAQSPARFIQVWRSLLLSDHENRALYEILVRYCCYDQRKRQNYSETWDALA